MGDKLSPFLLVLILSCGRSSGKLGEEINDLKSEKIGNLKLPHLRHKEIESFYWTASLSPSKKQLLLQISSQEEKSSESVEDFREESLNPLITIDTKLKKSLQNFRASQNRKKFPRDSSTEYLTHRKNRHFFTEGASKISVSKYLLEELKKLLSPPTPLRRPYTLRLRWG